MSTRTTKIIGTHGISSAQVGEFWVSFQFDASISLVKWIFTADSKSASFTRVWVRGPPLVPSSFLVFSSIFLNKHLRNGWSFIRRLKCSEVQLSAASSAQVGEFWVTFFRYLNVNIFIFYTYGVDGCTYTVYKHPPVRETKES